MRWQILVDNLVTNQCFLSPLPVLLFSSMEFISDAAPVVSVPYLAKAAIYSANVVLLSVFENGAKRWDVEGV